MRQIIEASINTQHVACECIEFDHKKKFGCIGYNGNLEDVFLMEFDSVKDLVDVYGIEEEAWLGIDKIAVGEKVDDGCGNFYVRIW